MAGVMMHNRLRSGAVRTLTSCGSSISGDYLD
uniref:Uncharacterized protein n=1 Tax=Arundo donax TaxID=35708 RepID=A0A0A8YAN1_ARUDO